MSECNEVCDNRSKVRWQCRRGMRELDVLLLSFFDTGYDTLSKRERNLFISLLSYPDNDLLEWLMARSEPKDSELNHVITQIRNSAVP